LLEAVEERRALRETTVPTSDADVRAALRAIKEPVTLFGEHQVQLHWSLLHMALHAITALQSIYNKSQEATACD